MRLAMWSGPRSMSTALMRAFSMRADCAVWDEPLYAAYLAATGVDHPMRAEIIARYQTDWRAVTKRCVSASPAPVWYQKHIAAHMLPEFGLGWTDGLTNAFLIRAPERILASYDAKRAAPAERDIGYLRLGEIFDRAADRLGAAPPVIDADDLFARPEPMLRALCAALGLEFDPAMLSWPKGPRPDEGIWGAHWYDALWNSTGLTPRPLRPLPELPEALRPLCETIRPVYAKLAAVRLQAGPYPAPG